MTIDLPLSARFCWWGTAWIRGEVSPDELIDEVAGVGPLLPTLATWRSRGCRGLSLALPVEGDLLGLAGPSEFNVGALDAGEAVLTSGSDSSPDVRLEWGLLPEGDPVRWQIQPAGRGVVPDLSEADKALRSELLAAGGRLAELDVARWRPDVADALMNLRHRPACPHPASTPAACVNLAARSMQALGIVEIALADDGGAVSSSEIDARRCALHGLEHTARRGLVAACSPEGWPPNDVQGR